MNARTKDLEPLDVYLQFELGLISIDEAAEFFQMSPKALKISQTKLGAKIPVIIRILKKISCDEITRQEAAETLEVDVRQVNRLMAQWGVKRPIKDYLLTRESSQVKWELQIKFATDYIADRLTLAQASNLAGLQERQMRRRVAQLLPEGTVFKDLAYLLPNERIEIAEQIRKDKALEAAKIQVANQVADGKMSIRDEATKRVVSRKVVNERPFPPGPRTIRRGRAKKT